ncbi:MAG: 30S ribosomal protein S12 methylthiotransferase RimO [Oscillospiraceae bacterium]|jgi:ribosomal protein S12 methylthiotransferase|nr:30S ribosomal protein S12 methylthiotransferase RimO [Oscillospiraceae bacterium]
MGKTVGLVSLGCDKNLINSEQMLWKLMDAGYEVLEVAELAEIVIINTCAFIEAAKTEAIENILEIAAAKKVNRIDGVGGNVEKIIVCGCLSERYREEIIKEIPEIDALVGTGSFDEIVRVVDEVAEGKNPCVFGDINAQPEEGARFLTGQEHTAHIKIAEGCDNRCAYCVIPSLRGRYRSRRLESIVEEAKDLAENGVRELILVAQDVTNYGFDLYGRQALPELLDELCAIEKVRWVRLHYLYPERLTDEIIAAIKRNDKALRYLDIPIQHINDGILKRMNRRSTSDSVKKLINKLRGELEGVRIRTSIIAGLPGEGEAEFTELCEFLKEYKLERAGFFAFSPEEGAPAAEMEDIPDGEVTARRVEILYGIQQRVMDEYNETCVGAVFDVICEGYDNIIEYYFGRTYADAPDIDGKVFFKSAEPVRTGEICEVFIEGTLDGDLLGRA